MCPKPCPDCGTGMKPVDDMESERAKFVCPDCAPPFILCRVTTYTDLEPEEFGYKT
jgi:hypothetical protein